jgi:hypothetical protein
MGAPVSKIEAAEEKSAEDLLSAFKDIAPPERRKHASVYNYWLSLRRKSELPPIRDLDALEISDAAPCGMLLELIEAGEDAEVLHVGETLRDAVQTRKLKEAANPSLLSCIGCKLGIVAISRDVLAFEDHFLGPDGTTRCSVTLLPFSAAGEAADFVYCVVSVETGVTFAEKEPEANGEEDIQPAEQAEVPEAAAEGIFEEQQIEPAAESEPEIVETQEAVEEQVEETPEPVAEELAPEPVYEIAEELVPEPAEEIAGEPEPEVAEDGRAHGAKPGFSSKVFDALAGAKGFFGTVAPAPDPELPAEPIDEMAVVEEPEAVAEEPSPIEEPAPVASEPVFEVEETAPAIEEQFDDPAPIADEAAPVAEEPAPVAEPEPPHRTVEGSLQSKLTDVRSKADEARMARLRSEALLVEGLSAAYDFALDAEEAPEEYLKLVEEQGLKIQLRSPMKPVVKLTFDGYCDDGTIKELEAVLAWALKADLPRGTLAERIEAEGGISAVATGQKARRSTDA